MITMSIIGTAGRGTDAKHLKMRSFEIMLADALHRVRAVKPNVLVSGGAAWADHLAVSLYLAGEVEHLHLYLPADWKSGRFVETGHRSAGSVANYYHAKFGKAIYADLSGISTWDDIQAAFDKGATAHVHHGFFNRNLEVARSDFILAYTFGTHSGKYMPADAGFSDPVIAGLKDGGTAHTWLHATGALAKRHVNLFELLEAK